MTEIDVPGFGTVHVRLSGGLPGETNGRWRGAEGTQYAVLNADGKDVGAAGDFVFSVGKGADTAREWRADPVGTRIDPGMPGTPAEKESIEIAVLAAFEADLGADSPEMLTAERETRQSDAARLRRQVEAMEESTRGKRRKIRELEDES